MAVSVKVKGGDRLRKYFEPLLDTPKARVGIFENSTYDARPESGSRAGQPVAKFAAVHEYGYGDIPARAPFRRTIEGKKGPWKEKLKAALKASPDNPEAALEIIGQTAALDVQKGIEAASFPPPLKKSTVRRKIKLGHGASAGIPLVLSGLLRDAIESRIVRGSES
jgi:hypothetical protein